MSALYVGWFDVNGRRLVDIELWEDAPELVVEASLAMAAHYQAGGRKSFLSSVWVVFDLVDVLRVFSLAGSPPRPMDVNKINALVDALRVRGVVPV
jgi:hypothetical protein